MLLTLIKPIAWIGRGLMLAALLGWFCLNSTLLQSIRVYDGLDTYDWFFDWIDSLTGYSWESATLLASRHPFVAEAMNYVYNSSIQQILLLFVLLVLFRPQHEAARMITTNGVSLMCAMLIWCAFPNFGPSAYIQLEPGLSQIAHVSVDNNYGAKMVHAATHGLTSIDFDTVIGMISFPSYHMVLTCLILYFCYPMRPLFWVAVPVHLLTIPAILVTGGHLVIDLIGGIGVFLAGLKLSDYLLSRRLPMSYARFVPGPLTPLEMNGEPIFKRRLRAR
ncbi:phosphatase PAP2 family protein [Limoniibacter endophyticus]|nr:phosphatase PAP2 family protein [Limoniibacter endophyticus]